VKPEVAKAVEELIAGAPGSGVRSKEDPDGGAFVIVDGVNIGVGFDPASSWVGFHIGWPYPDADVYPHFIDPAVRYVGDGPAPNEHPDGALPTSMSRGALMPGFELPSVQVSRRSNRRNAGTDTALCKLLRVIEFLRSR
jgi:hypothetical protein